MATHFSLFLLLLAAAMQVSLADVASERPWPQWQGPHRNAISTETGLVQKFRNGGPKRLWLFEDCGIGYAGPAIVGDRLYIMGAFEGIDCLLCIDAQSGEKQWDVPLGPTFENDWGDGPRSTPTVNGDNIFLMTPRGMLYCLHVDDGSVIWSKAMQDLGGKTPAWGYSESPLVLDERVYCTPGGDQGAIAALDKRTGDLIWQCKEYPDIAHYSSIVPMEQNGRTILVQLLYKELVGVDSSLGTGLWSVPWNGNVAVIPTPIVYENTVYATSGYGAGCTLVKLEGNEVEVVYENKNMTNHHGGVILHEGHLFGYSDGKGWVCQDHDTGETVWREREALGKGAIAYADNRFYCLSEDTGELVLIAASIDGWQEHGRFTLTPQTQLRKPKGKIWVHPVIADGNLYLRDQDYLFCFDLRAE